MTDGTDDMFILHSVLPGMAIRDPITCAGVVFCTTRHLDQYSITPAKDRKALLTVASNCRDSHGNTLDCVGVVLVPEPDAEVLISDGIPRICRDVVALCYITGGTALNCHHGQATTVYNADYFEALPIHFHSDGFVIRRPGLLGLNSECKHLFPTLPVYLSAPRDTDFQLDKRLFEACDSAVRAFTRGQHRRELQQVFRAIAVSMHATRIMPETESTYHDVGPRIIGWVSAFETLVHSGRGRVGLRDVIQLIREVRWHDGRPAPRGGRGRREISLNHQRYIVKDKKGRVIVRETSACQLYRRLYRLRNDVAHGNAIRPKEFAAQPGNKQGPRIDQIAPLLFRGCALERLREIGVVERIPQTGALTLAQFQASVGESLDASRFDEALAKTLFGRDDD